MTQATAEENKLHYVMGPNLARFHRDNSRIRGVRGPIRTGKSVACAIEVLRRARDMAPCADGVRRARCLVVRNTYGQLTDTTIQTFCEWISPATYGRGRGFRTSPYPNFDIGCDADDGSPVELEVWFRALDRPEHLRNLLSMEFTYFWANEARELQRSFIDWLESRSGQYPAKIHQPAGYKGPWPSFYGGWMDTNAPDEDHWWYDLFEKQCNPGHPDHDPAVGKKFKQFFIPRTENEHNLPDNYYEELKVGKDKEWIKVYVNGEYGLVIEGKAVYPEYSDPYHCREKDYEPVKGMEIVRGWDIGNTMWPSVVFAQVNQGLEVFDEILMGDTGVHAFKYAVVEYCNQWYPGYEFRDFGDPAMNSPAMGDKEERTIKQIFAAEPNPIQIAPGHVAFSGRREAVNRLLLRVAPPTDTEAAQPFFRLSPRCRTLRTGFKGRYGYPEIGQNTGRYHDKPEKNKYSHPHDALQYLVTGLFSPTHDKNRDRSYVPKLPRI